MITVLLFLLFLWISLLEKLIAVTITTRLGVTKKVVVFSLC